MCERESVCACMVVVVARLCGGDGVYGVMVYRCVVGALGPLVTHIHTHSLTHTHTLSHTHMYLGCKSAAALAIIEPYE